jgi:diguanylate cyclase (GGDEF)-like protein
MGMSLGDQPNDRLSRRREPGNGPPISRVLAAMVAVPIVALAVSNGSHVNRALKTKAAAESVARESSRLHDLSDLNVALRTESSMSFVAIGARKFGVPLSMAPALLGLDVERRGQQSRDEVDRLIARLGKSSPVAASAVDSARRDADNPKMVDIESGTYAKPLRLSLAAVEKQVLRLRASSIAVGDDEDLLAAEVATERTTKALSESLDQSGPVLAIAVGADLSADSMIRLQAATGTLRKELDHLADLNDPSSVVIAARQIAASPEQMLITKRAESTVSSGAIADPSTRSVVVALTWRSDRLMQLAQQSSEITVERAEVLAQEARVDVVRKVAVLIGTLLVSLLGALLVGRSITRSLRRLERKATELVSGSASSDRLPTSGPRELAVTARAFNQLIDEYTNLGRQAQALASGDLTHSSLALQPEGGLGQAVHETVQRLVESIHLSERTRIELKYEATHDPLTKLFNWAAAREILQGCLDSGDQVSVISVDLDGFKLINDEHGHLVGDQVLQEVSRRMTNSLRDVDPVCRVGGDEFLVICPGTGSSRSLRSVAERINLEFARPVVLGELSLTVGVSLGTAMLWVNDSVESILARADSALYGAKAQRRRHLV